MKSLYLHTNLHGCWRQNTGLSISTAMRIQILQTVLAAVAELRKVTISVVMSVLPHGTTRLPQDRFS